MRMSDVKDFLGLIVLCVVVCFIFVIALCGPIFLGIQVTKGATVIYTGEIIATRQSTFLWEHTTIVMKTYAEEAVTFTIEGLYEFDIGGIYKIETRGSFWRLYRSLIDYQSLQGSANE